MNIHFDYKWKGKKSSGKKVVRCIDPTVGEKTVIALSSSRDMEWNGFKSHAGRKSGWNKGVEGAPKIPHIIKFDLRESCDTQSKRTLESLGKKEVNKIPSFDRVGCKHQWSKEDQSTEKQQKIKIK
ncbi:hypothetical protein ACJX0J_036340 [Zea mays]